MLLKVGELAKHTGLTVRTLHHFDEIGLLKPSGCTIRKVIAANKYTCPLAGLFIANEPAAWR